MASRQSRVELRERLEQALEITSRDTDTRISHRETNVAIVALDVESDLALVGELHRVSGEVDQDLPDLVDVARHADRRVRDDIFERELLLACQRLDDRRGRAHEIGGEKIGRTNG